MLSRVLHSRGFSARHAAVAVVIAAVLLVAGCANTAEVQGRLDGLQSTVDRVRQANRSSGDADRAIGIASALLEGIAAQQEVSAKSEASR